jgi:ABC-type sulfate/molybdate transport systems ATPase subunit
MAKPDVFSIRNTSVEAYAEPLVHEVKVRRADLLADLRDLLASAGTAALFVTHDRHEAAAIADRVAVLHAGTVRQYGPPGAVLDHPADADCARLLGFENVLGEDLAARLLHPPRGRAAALRAADTRLVPGGAGVVERVLPFGPRTRIAAVVAGTRILSDVPATQLATGDAVDVQADADAVRLIAPV